MPGEADRTSRRLALLIATSKYDDPDLGKLRAPGRDADGLARVLGDPDIGGFDDVRKKVNAKQRELLMSIDDFCAEARRDDLVLVYLSCHGLLDAHHRLRYAATDTTRQRLAATAVASSWLNERLDDCAARAQILILDCCHSGAFAGGRKGSSLDLDLSQWFTPQGRGRVVLTASRGTEYSFENGHPSGEGVQSVFTRILVEGLRSGEADLDGDGNITIREIYKYLFDKVQVEERRQTPQLWSYGVEGDVLLARSAPGVVSSPSVPGTDAPRVQVPEHPRNTGATPAPEPRRVRRVLTRRRAIIVTAAILATVLAVTMYAFYISGPPATLRWSYSTTGPVDSSPAVADGTVYVGSDGGYVYALDDGTGHLLWSDRTGGPVGSKPAVADGTVYVGSGDGHVYALDADTGRVRWSRTPGGSVDSPAAVAGGTVYIGSNGGYVYALDASTGHLRWSHQVGQLNVSSSLVVAGDLVYVGCTNGDVFALAAGTGNSRWSYQTGGPVNSSPTVAGGNVYIGSDDGRVYALDAATGRSRWSYLTGSSDDVYPSPVVAGVTVYVGSDDGRVYALNIRTGHVRWSYATQGPVDSAPAVVGGTVYIGSDDGNVYALDASTGHFRWSYPIAGIRFSGPKVVDDTDSAGITIYIGSNEGDEVYALRSRS